MYYYFVFIFIICSILLDQILLLNLQNIFSNFPTYLFLHTLYKPYSLPNGYSIVIEEASPKGVSAFRIVPNTCNKGSVFAHLKAEFGMILNEVSPPKIIGMIVRGDNLFYVMRDLLNITNR